MSREVSWLKIGGVVANLLLPAIALAYIWVFGNELPKPDDWAFIDKLEKQVEGTLRFHDVWESYFSHRLFFPQILMLALAPFTKWSLRAEMLVNYCFLLATAMLLWSIFRRGRSRETLVGDLWAFLPISAMIFGFKQFDNLLWGWQLQIGMSLFGTVATIYLLSLESKKWGFLGSLGTGVLASFSFASGLLVWPLGSITLFLQKRKLMQQLLWLLCGTVATTLYIINLVLPRMEAGLRIGNLLSGLLAVIGATLPLSSRAASAYPIWGQTNMSTSTGMGANTIDTPSVSDDMLMAKVVGSLILTLGFAVLYLRCKITQRFTPWAFILLFGIGASVIIAAGRLQEEPANALLSRYATLASYAVIGTYGLAITTWRETRSRKLIPILVSLTLSISIGISFSIAIASEWGKYAPLRWAMDQKMMNALIQQAEGRGILDPQLKWVEDHEWMRRNTAVLQRLGYAFFAERR